MATVAWLIYKLARKFQEGRTAQQDKVQIAGQFK